MKLIHKPRTLVEICDEFDLHKEIIDTPYCGVGLCNKVDCPRQDKYVDKNGMYRCLDLRWNNYQNDNRLV